MTYFGSSPRGSLGTSFSMITVAPHSWHCMRDMKMNSKSRVPSGSSSSLSQFGQMKCLSAMTALCRQIDHCEDFRFRWIAKQQHQFVQFDLGGVGRFRQSFIDLVELDKFIAMLLALKYLHVVGFGNAADCAGRAFSSAKFLLQFGDKARNARSRQFAEPDADQPVRRIREGLRLSG
jgi:hypothetical protein